MAIEFQVVGQPATQGSKKVVPIYKGGSPLIKNGRVLTRAVDDNPKTADWRQQVAAAARQAYDGPLLDGPVSLRLLFERPRPAGDLGTGRNAGKVKPTARAYPTTKPDLTKLTRAIEDSLKGVVWRDDSQVVSQVIDKRWGDCFRVYVCVDDLTPVVPRAEESPSQAGESTPAFPDEVIPEPLGPVQSLEGQRPLF